MPVIKDLSMSAYNEIVAVRSSDLKPFALSPAHYKYYKQAEREEGPALAIGSAAHTLILEPDKFDKEFIIYKAHKTRCQAFYVAAASNPGKILLLESEANFVKKLAESVRNKSHVMDLVNSSSVELSVTGKLQGVFCKCRCDGYNFETGRIIDIKTTGKLAKDFRRTIWDFGYHYSNAFYKMVMEANNLIVNDFVFIVIEKDPPFEVRLCKIDKEWVDDATTKIKEMLDLFSKCLTTDTWPGYSTEIEELKLNPDKQEPTIIESNVELTL